MARLRRSHLAWLATLVPLGFALLAVAFGIAWLTAPSVAGMGARVRALDHSEGAHPVRLAEIAPVMREAVVATEDERFYRHDGIDVIGIMRALPYDLSHFSLAEGASTITEQLAKLVYLGGNDHNPWAKLRDAALALRVDSAYSKDQILRDYLNTIYFGAGAYGVQVASERYFGVPASRLDLAQATMLAGLIQDPSADQPYADPTDTRQRQADALASMVRGGYATEREARAAAAEPLRLAHGPRLAPLPSVDLEPGPPFYWGELALGGGILVLGVAGFLLASRYRRRIGGVRLVSARVAATMLSVAGVLLVFASLRGA
jgi:membrane carboxypeptidase/penicillin-binding protein PbpC